jgi:hypothetical protein
MNNVSQLNTSPLLEITTLNFFPQFQTNTLLSQNSMLNIMDMDHLLARSELCFNIYPKSSLGDVNLLPWFFTSPQVTLGNA